MGARTSEVPSRVPNVKHALTVNDHDPALAAVAIPERRRCVWRKVRGAKEENSRKGTERNRGGASNRGG